MKLPERESPYTTNGLRYPKPIRPQKPKKQLKTKTRLNSKQKPIPIKVKQAVLHQKGRLCFLGHCPNCGAALVTENDDFHHFPHRSKGGKDIVSHLWPCRRQCHSFVHENPILERMMMHEIEKAGYEVIWKAQTKGIGYREAG